MNRTALTSIAPEIFRKRLLVEGYFQSNMAESVLREYFRHITSELGLRTYGDPIIHKTSGEGKDLNEGYDAFVPLIDSGIYISCSKARFAARDGIANRFMSVEGAGRFRATHEDTQDVAVMAMHQCRMVGWILQ
jgi:hypothetical protein